VVLVEDVSPMIRWIVPGASDVVDNVVYQPVAKTLMPRRRSVLATMRYNARRSRGRHRRHVRGDTDHELIELVAPILGFVGALLGVALGAWLNAHGSERAEARRDEKDDLRRRLELRAAARLVYTDLRAAELAASSDASRRSVAALGSLTVDAWPTYRHALAGELSDAAYDEISEACNKVVWTVELMALLGEADEQPPAELFDSTLPEITRVRQFGG
jgi:hypothetical protein